MVTFDWHEVWERKGRIRSDDLKELDGFEETTINPKEATKKIIKALNIKKDNKVLEVGCGAGMIAYYLTCDYTGIDYSESLVKRHIELLRNHVLVSEANNLPFLDKSFNRAFSYSVFHYFPNKQYAKKALNEMKRVCSGPIFIGDLPFRSHRQEHLLFKTSDFPEGIISEGYYNKDRFNVLLFQK